MRADHRAVDRLQRGSIRIGLGQGGQKHPLDTGQGPAPELPVHTKLFRQVAQQRPGPGDSEDAVQRAAVVMRGGAHLAPGSRS